MLLTPILSIVNVLIDRLVPNKTKAQEIRDKLSEMAASGELEALTAQIDLNKQEAGHRTVFVAGWRPFIGWVCGASLAYQYIGRPIIIYISAARGIDYTFVPSLDDNLWQLMTGMLGLGTLRTFEKINKAAK